MLTWFKMWPLLTLPFLFCFLIGLLPDVALGEFTLSGALVRQYFVNLIASILPHTLAFSLVGWFDQATTAQELILHCVISLNVGLVFYPLFFALGHCAIRLSVWRTRSELAESKTLLNRR